MFPRPPFFNVGKSGQRKSQLVSGGARVDVECGPLTGLPRFLEEEGVEMEISLPDLLLLAYPDWPATSQKLCGRPFPAERPTPGASKSLPQPPPTPPDPWPLTSVDETRAAVVTLVEKSRRGSALALRGWGVGSVQRPPLGVSISFFCLPVQSCLGIYVLKITFVSLKWVLC